MKKTIFSVFIAIVVAVFLSNSSYALAKSDLYISRISGTDGSEFIELHNKGGEVISGNLKITSGTKKTNIIDLMDDFAISSNGKIIIGQSSGSDYIYSKDAISEKAIISVFLNDNLVSYFCADSNERCKGAGISKNSTDLQGGKIAVFTENYNAKKGYDYSLISEKTGENAEIPQPTPVEDLKDNEEDLAETPEIPEVPILPEDDCRNFRITEISTNSGEQFIEIENFSDEISNLKSCVLVSSASSPKKHIFGELEIEPMKFFVLKISESSLKLNKTTKGGIFLLDSENSQIQSVKFEPLKAESSWAFFEEGWKQTFEITPDEENVFLELPCKAGYERDSNTSECVKIKLPEEEKKCAEGYFLNPESGRCKKLEEPKAQAECAAGYFRNPETGRCKKVEIEDLPTPCASGYYRNPETGRCRKIATLASATLTPCKEGYYRHPETNRCRKIASETEELTQCKEGYEQNPETNRCRKIVRNLAAEEKVETSDDPRKSEFTGWWAVFGVVFVLISVVLWEFRKSILTFFKNGKK